MRQIGSGDDADWFAIRIYHWQRAYLVVLEQLANMIDTLVGLGRQYALGHQLVNFCVHIFSGSTLRIRMPGSARSLAHWVA